MKRNALILAAILPILGLATASHAIDETRVRQDAQNLKIIGTPGQNVLWTMSGYPNSVIATPFCNATVSQIMANPGAYGVYQAVANSGGQYSLRFCKVFKSQWIGQQACVYTNGTLTDSDLYAAQ